MLYIIRKKKQKDKKPLTDAEKLVKENFLVKELLLMKYFNELYIRWVFDDKTEGDDLIAYYVEKQKTKR